jgi:hypothetical protein
MAAPAVANGTIHLQNVANEHNAMEAAMAETRTPVSLAIVAGLFLIEGIFALMRMWAGLQQGGIGINLGIVGLPISIGLLRFSNTWRIIAVTYIWILVPILLFLTVLIAQHDGPVPMTAGSPVGPQIGTISKKPALAIIAVVVLIALWQQWVLLTDPVRRLFRSDEPNDKRWQRREFHTLAAGTPVRVTGVISHVPPKAVEGDAAGGWLVVYTFEAWRIEGGPLQTGYLVVHQLLTDEEYTRMDALLPPHTAVRLNARVTGQQAFVHQFIGPDDSDPELNDYAIDPS